MHIYPQYMHIKYCINVMHIFEMAAILGNFLISPVYMVKLRALIFGSVMYLYWATHREEIRHLWKIFLKL